MDLPTLMFMYGGTPRHVEHLSEDALRAGIATRELPNGVFRIREVTDDAITLDTLQNIRNRLRDQIINVDMAEVERQLYGTGTATYTWPINDLSAYTRRTETPNMPHFDLEPGSDIARHMRIISRALDRHNVARAVLTDHYTEGEGLHDRRMSYADPLLQVTPELTLREAMKALMDELCEEELFENTGQYACTVRLEITRNGRYTIQESYDFISEDNSGMYEDGRIPERPTAEEDEE